MKKSVTPQRNRRPLVIATTAIILIIAAFAGYKISLSAKTAQAPACPDPILQISPVDIALATEILYPGQYRGGDYKAHGGFRLQTGAAAIKLPFDARIVGANRYIETVPGTDQRVLQYLLTFEHECGVQVRFDHLYTLTPAIQAVMDTTPEAKLDDTRSQPLENGPSFTAGTVIATAVGMPEIGNTGFDFGLYDLRTPNEISKNPTWAALHENYSSQAYYGRCWIDYLSEPVKQRALQILPLATDDRGASDYCTFAAGGKTLDYNGGRPVTGHATPNRAR